MSTVVLAPVAWFLLDVSLNLDAGRSLQRAVALGAIAVAVLLPLQVGLAVWRRTR